MKLTEQQLFDYITCPAYFEMKWVRGITMEDPVSLPKLLDKVGKYFYLNLLNRKILGSHELKKKWDSLCYQSNDYMDSKKCIEGMEYIMKLTLWAKNEKLVVLDVDTPYTILIGGVELSGQTGVIQGMPDSQLSLLVTDFSSRATDPWMIDMKHKYTLDAYAFTELYQKPLIGIKVHSVKYNKDFFSQRTGEDYQRLKTTIKNVGKAIEQRIFYPRESSTCANCQAREMCKGWDS